MMQLQKMADPILRRIKEIEANFARSAPAQGTPERTKLETELVDLKQQQQRLSHQFLLAKAHLLQSQGLTAQSQQLMAQAQAMSRQTSQAASSSAYRPPAGQAQRPLTPQQQQQTLNQQSGAASATSGPGTPQQHRNSPAAAARVGTPGGQAAAAASSPAVGQGSTQQLPASAVLQQQQHPHVPAEAMIQRSGSAIGSMGAIPAHLNVSASVPEGYPNASGPRATLNQGLGTHPVLGTPAILRRPDVGGSGSGSNAAAAAGGGGGAAGGSGAAAGGAAGAINSANLEELLGFRSARDAPRSNATSDAEAIESGNPEYWDNLTGKGTGAESLLSNAVSSAGAGGATTTMGGGGGAAGAGGAGGQTSAEATPSNDGRLLTKRKVQELVAEIDGNERLEGDVEDVSTLVSI